MALFLPSLPEGSTDHLYPYRRLRHRVMAPRPLGGSVGNSAGGEGPGWEVKSSKFSSTSWAAVGSSCPSDPTRPALLLATVQSRTGTLFHQTSPSSFFDREVQSKPRVPDIVLAGPFPLICLCSVGKRKVLGSNVLIGRERVAAALLIASKAACSSKASRANARIMKRLASSSHSSTTFG